MRLQDLLENQLPPEEEPVDYWTRIGGDKHSMSYRSPLGDVIVINADGDIDLETPEGPMLIGEVPPDTMVDDPLLIHNWGLITRIYARYLSQEQAPKNVKPHRF